MAKVKKMTELENKTVEENKKDESRELLDIATRIRRIGKRQKRDILKVGNLLHRAKKLLPHGQYEEWFEANLGDQFSLTTAYYWRSIYEMCEEEKIKPDVFEKIPLRYLLIVIKDDLPLSIFDMIKDFSRKGLKENFEKVVQEHKAKINLEALAAIGHKESLDKSYTLLKKFIIADLKEIKKIQSRFRDLPSRFTDLLTTPYNEIENYGYLQLLREKGLIDEVEKSVEILQEVMRVYNQSCEDYREATEKKLQKAA